VTHARLLALVLAVAAAIVAYGVATDGWCKSQSEGVLKAK